MIEALGHPVFYIAFWVIILGYAAWRLWRIERLLAEIKDVIWRAHVERSIR